MAQNRTKILSSLLLLGGETMGEMEGIPVVEGGRRMLLCAFPLMPLQDVEVEGEQKTTTKVTAKHHLRRQ